MSIKRRFAQTIQMFSSAPIPNAGTLVFPYPTGEAQTSAWDGAGHTLVDGSGNVYSAGFSVAFGATTITLTNSSLGTIPANTKLRLNLRKLAFLNADVLFDPAASILDKIAVARVLGLPVVLGMSAVAVSAPADTSEDTLATVAVPANSMGLNGVLRIWTRWTVNNNANGKTIRARLTTTINGPTTLASKDFYEEVILLRNRGATNSQLASTMSFGTGANSAPALTPAVDTTLATNVTITAQKATAGDTMTLESYLVELIPG